MLECPECGAEFDDDATGAVLLDNHLLIHAAVEAGPPPGPEVNDEILPDLRPPAIDTIAERP